jgi:N-acyl-D-aspartate/D-glutamate deacylase
LKRLAVPANRERAKTDMNNAHADWENQWWGAGGGPGVLLISVINPALKKYEGKTLEEIGKLEGKDPRDVVMDVVAADHANSQCINFIMSEEDVKSALQHRLVAFCTDANASAEDGIYSEEKSHPRAWGSTARILGKYVRDEKALPLEEAVRKMTSFCAARARIMDRGILRAGMMADVVAFDLATVHDVATFADPNHYSVGFQFVTVNGKLVVDGGKITRERPGRIVYGPGYVGTK